MAFGDQTACLACGTWPTGPLCSGCRPLLAAGGKRRLPAGLVVAAPFRHAGPARRLVHRLKYEGSTAAATTLAAAVVKALPAGTGALVPVPRAALRRWRHGVDPSLELARALRARTGLPVLEALSVPLWWPKHAGSGRRTLPPFRRRRVLPRGAVLVDDVVTTGATLTAAYLGSGREPIGAVTATMAGRSLLAGSQAECSV